MALVPPAIYGIGLNYRAHCVELKKQIPAFPVVFTKSASAISTGPITLPGNDIEPWCDYEGELAVVIGRRCFAATPANALDHVAGYCIANDVSGRYWQFHQPNGGQWAYSKSFDSFLPLSDMVPAKEVGDPQSLDILTTLNGVTVQQSNTSDMIFSVAELIVFLSQSTTLLPGTVILTGTPEGPGHFRDPPRYLQAGDVVTITIEKLGTLTSEVVAKPSSRL